MKIYHLLEGGGGRGKFSLSCLICFSGGERSGSLRPWSCLSALHLIVRFSYKYHATSYSYLRECYLFHFFPSSFMSRELQILLSSHHHSFLHFQGFSIPQQRACFLAFSEPGQSFRNHPAATAHLAWECSCRHIFSRQGTPWLRLYWGRWGVGGQDCLLSQKAKHLGWESLTVCLRTQTERTKASRKRFCQGDLHLSSIQLCSKESHLNTQYISSTPASDPIWEIHA